MKEKLLTEIKEFIDKHPNAQVITYEAGIPTSDARTGGHGDPARGYVLFVGENFKTRNSPHVRLGRTWSFRRDYGTIKGHCYQCRKEMEESAAKWKEKIKNLK